MSQSDNFAKQNYLTGRNEFTSSYTLLNNFKFFTKNLKLRFGAILEHFAAMFIGASP